MCRLDRRDIAPGREECALEDTRDCAGMCVSVLPMPCTPAHGRGSGPRASPLRNMLRCGSSPRTRMQRRLEYREGPGLGRSTTDQDQSKVSEIPCGGRDRARHLVHDRPEDIPPRETWVETFRLTWVEVTSTMGDPDLPKPSFARGHVGTFRLTWADGRSGPPHPKGVETFSLTWVTEVRIAHRPPWGPAGRSAGAR